jgi:hypothetical protein
MELATVKERAEQSLAQLAEHAGSSRQARMLQHEAERIEHKYGKKLERLARQLPIDTPLDRKRRSRVRRHGVEVGVLVLALAGAAAVYVVLRNRESDRAHWDTDAAESDAGGSPSDATQHGTSNGSKSPDAKTGDAKTGDPKMTSGAKSSAAKSSSATKPGPAKA